MKRITSYLVCTFVALALIGTLTTCVPQYDEPGSGYGGNGRLSVSATVSEATVVTKAASVEALMEKQLNTLDVFVEHVTGTTGDGTFLKQYHLVATTDKPILEGATEAANNWLADNWRTEGLVFGEKYNIYVAVNNTKTASDVTNVTALKELTYSEVEEGLAVVNPDNNNITWPWTDQFANTPSGFIYKQYVSDDDASSVTVGGSLYGFTTEKEFMMDGVIKNWTPVSGSKDQVFGGDSNGPLTLKRAAAKFILNVKFDADFLKSLTHNKVDGNWVEKPAAEKVTITGKPAWRFYNFAFGAPVFAPETQGAGVEVHSSETLLRHPYAYAGNDKNFQIITYSYPNMWVAADYSTAAPSLVISVGYGVYKNYNNAGQPVITGDDDVDYITSYHYYRIPLVKNTVTKIERNHIYVINATIATKGSATKEDQTVTEDIEYKVLKWNDANNSAAIQNNVESIQHYYFRVNPKIYTLRGDGDQSVILNYSKASGTKVNWKLFTYDDEGNQTGVVANNDANAIRAWFYNADDKFTTTYNDNESGMNWSNTGPTPMGVKIEQSTEGTSGSTGTVTVTSHALNNRAIKYIRLRVYLDESATFQDGKETMYEDIIIRHFPTDNIQNIEGSWSSYHDAGSGSQQVALTTTSLVEAEAWKTQYGVNYTTEEISKTDYLSYAEYNAHAGEEGYSMNGPTASDYTTFHNMVGTENRQNANSQANAIADPGEGHNYYWGTNPVVVHTGNNWNGPGEHQYDYRVWSNRQWQWMKYQNYYTASYTHSYSFTQYSMTVEMVSTGNWVDWERDAGQTYNQANAKYTRGSIFTAKVYDDSRNRIYAIEPTGDIVYHPGGMFSPSYYSFSYLTYGIAQYYTQGNYYVYSINDAIGTAGGMDLTNNHMYVIQISSTSEGYIMGRPILGNPNQYLSQDDVVSPAFMIASQLGAVTPTNDNQTAATHCSNYMEVAADGTRYTGWRLPTADEIRVITRYQNGTINGVTISNANYQAMTPVLTGRTYWSLTGEAVNSGIGEGGPYLRCVRDLSAEEVNRLNGFDKIIEKYQ